MNVVRLQPMTVEHGECPRRLPFALSRQRQPAVAAFLAVLFCSSCGFGSADVTPLVVAHRAAPSLWPENSRTAVLGSLDRGFPAIEIDIVLTSDHVPVIAHDPWLDPRYCTKRDGSDMLERVLVADLTLEELETGYLCGGKPSASFPDAPIVADTLLTLDELIDLLRPYPAMTVQLDIKYEPGLTPSTEVFAQEVLSRWTTSGISNPWYVSANLPELLLSFREWMRGAPVETVLIYPRFPPDSDSTVVAIRTELLGAFGIRDALGEARRAKADGIAWPWELMDWHAADAARRAGLSVKVWTVNDEDHLRRFCEWPVDSIITDYPDLAPCL